MFPVKCRAKKLYETGERRASNRFPGYPVCVNGKYYLAIEKPKTTHKRSSANA